jgi:hypothetical protein
LHLGAGVKADSDGEIRDSLLEVSLAVKRNTPVVIRVRVFRLKCDGCGVISNGRVEVAELVVREAAVEECLEVPRVLSQRHLRRAESRQ